MKQKRKPKKKVTKKRNKFGAQKVGKFRSKLEKRCHDRLVEEGIKFRYEPFEYILLPGFVYTKPSKEKIGRKFKDASIQVKPIKYIPDFIGNKWIIETKGVRTASFNLKWKLLKSHFLINDLDYHLFVPSNHAEIDETIEIIKTL